jgi:hypothetical protein
MPNSKLKKRNPAPIIYFNDGLGGTIAIKSPVLLSIFQSHKLILAYKKNPDKKYSVKEIFELRNKDIPVKEATIRRALADNKEFFETTKDIEIRGRKGNQTVMVINFTKLKPITEFIFNAVEEFWGDDDED